MKKRYLVLATFGGIALGCVGTVVVLMHTGMLGPPPASMGGQPMSGEPMSGQPMPGQAMPGQPTGNPPPSSAAMAQRGGPNPGQLRPAGGPGARPSGPSNAGRRSALSPPLTLRLGKSALGRIASPKAVPMPFDTNFYTFQARAGQTVQVEVTADYPGKFRPFVSVWTRDRRGAPKRDIKDARGLHGKARLVVSFPRAANYILSVTDARNVPQGFGRPDHYYGGPGFTYSILARGSRTQALHHNHPQSP